MNINFDEYMVPIITVASLCIGYVMKKWLPTDDKWIPTVLFLFGALSGLIVCGLNYEGIVKGALSGLAAVGLHQAFKQHIKPDDCDKVQTNFNTETIEEMRGEGHETEEESAEKE